MTSRSPQRLRSRLCNRVDHQWLHDKFEECSGSVDNDQKCIPKPVPAPKPILWSTIGKDTLNGDRVKQETDYSPNCPSNKSPYNVDNYSPLGDTINLKEVGHSNDKHMDGLEHDDIRLDSEVLMDDSKTLI